MLVLGLTACKAQAEFKLSLALHPGIFAQYVNCSTTHAAPAPDLQYAAVSRTGQSIPTENKNWNLAIKGLLSLKDKYHRISLFCGN